MWGLLPGAFFSLIHSHTSSFPWRADTYIIISSALDHPTTTTTSSSSFFPSVPHMSVQNNLIPGGRWFVWGMRERCVYRRGTGAAHPYGEAPLLSTGMIPCHDNYRDHVHKEQPVVRRALWCLCGCQSLYWFPAVYCTEMCWQRSKI